jgi:fructose-1,6-bisphosphatase/sedoheptulose 1,7-bisphosphatase-like protein
MRTTRIVEMLEVTESAALAAARWMGRGEKNLADQAAVEAMREAFDGIDISGEIVIGEGERDEAPMLFIGEKVGRGGEDIDIAVDPLEGTNLTAYGQPNSLSVLAFGPKGSLLNAPDTYMMKVATGPASTWTRLLARTSTRSPRRSTASPRNSSSASWIANATRI